MDRVRQILRRARLLLRREAVEQAMDAEIRHHLDSEIEDLVRRGVPLESARRQALAAFGGVEPIKEAARDARGTRLAEDFAGDVRYGWRVLRRTPSVTISSILTFALGIGMAATIFSAVYGVLLRPLPYARPDRLVAVFEHDRIHGHDQNVVSLDNFDAWRERARSFSGWAALMPNPVTVTDRGAPERVVGAEVSWQYFRLLGVAPAIGRDFEDRDAKNGDAVILSDAFWKGRFGGDPSVVGRSMMISGKPYLIAGVMPGSFDPPRFGWLGGQALWFPMVETPEKRAWGRFLLVVARLRDGVTPRQAQAEMRAIASQRENETPDDKGWSATVVPLKEELTANARTTLFVLLGAVSLLLIMAVTNVATLTTSATWQRGAELAVRRAIGATDARLFRQLFVQSALLALFGTAVGVAAAFGGVRILVTLLPPETPRLSSIRVDSPVLAIVTTIAILATLTFGSIAATGGRASAAASDFTRLSEGARGTARRGGSLLISVEIALALALGVMAVLMARSLVRLRAVDLGFVAGDVTVARVALPATAYGTDETRRAFFDRLVERVRRVPGVAAAGLVSTRPLGGIGPATVVSDSRVLPSPESPPPVADVRWADGALFDVLRVVLVSGRTFGPVDGPGSPPRVILTRDLADRFWPAGDAVGHKLTIDLYGTITAEVIGVVGPVHLMDARTTPRPAIFLSATRFPSSAWDIVVRANAASDIIVPSLRAAIADLDPSLPLYAARTLPDLVGETLATDRFTSWLLGVFAAAALGLTSIGVFGVLAADVARRRREIGVRLALGASCGRIVCLMLGQAVRRAVPGIVAGGAVAVAASHTMRALLFGVTPDDPVSIGGVTALVLTVAVIATLIPVVRALRRAPLTALREN